MSEFVNSHRPNPPARNPRVERVIIEVPERGKGPLVLKGDAGQPETWLDEDGSYDVRCIREGRSFGFGLPLMRKGDIARHMHAHLVLNALDPEHLRHFELIAATPGAPLGPKELPLTRHASQGSASETRRRKPGEAYDSFADHWYIHGHYRINGVVFERAPVPPPLPVVVPPAPNAAAVDALKHAGDALAALAASLRAA